MNNDENTQLHGSIPCRAANLHLGAGCFSLIAIGHDFVRFLIGDAFIKCVVDHHHRRRPATGQAFDKFDRESAVRRGLGAMPRDVQAKLPANMFPQFMAAAQRAA